MMPVFLWSRPLFVLFLVASAAKVELVAVCESGFRCELVLDPHSQIKDLSPNGLI